MNRRDFCKHLALLAAGATALPAQVDAFESMYVANFRTIGHNHLISVHDITLGFCDLPRDTSYLINFYNRDRLLLSFPLNHRAMIRYVAPPEAPLLGRLGDFRWSIDAYSLPDNIGLLRGTIRFTDQEGLVRSTQITADAGVLDGGN